ncbi:MAG: GIY-YIG nuclease family protein [Phaeodactylibacter sp.]|nr:GIY-YIG nuclease family protein [Phaeodactylibacter sp.]MCB9052822.1 GIY-YIG nuclease family protein [Lewinellaceae bacterium]
MHYVYILYSPSADKFYVGQTPDIQTRLLFHNHLSENSFTSRFRPWQLRVCSNFDDESKVRKFYFRRGEFCSRMRVPLFDSGSEKFNEV